MTCIIGSANLGSNRRFQELPMPNPVPLCVGAIAVLALAACAPVTSLLAAPGGMASASVPVPPGATKLATLAAGAIRYFAVAPDHKRAAYMPEAPIGQLHVITFGGDDTQVADTQGDITGLCWSADGSALLYQQDQREVIPGQYVDWNIPATRYLSTRTLRARLTGGAPEVLLETTASTWFAVGGARMFYGTAGADGTPGKLQALRLDSGAKETLDAKPEGPVAVAPDGSTLAWPAGTSAVRLYDVASGELRTLEVATSGNIAWLSPDRLAITRYESLGSWFRVASRDGVVGPELQVGNDPGSVAFAIGKAGGADLVSPGGKWAIAMGKGKDPGAPIVSLETGKVYYSSSFAWRTWLDDATLVAILGGDVYTVPLDRAIDL